jgi:hypothetical protein
VLSLLFLVLPLSLTSGSGFPRFYTKDESDDWEPVFWSNKTLCNSLRNKTDLPDLDGVSYSSDGQKLNVTFWLNGKFQENNFTNLRQPIYRMGIILPNMKPLGVDYLVSTYYDTFPEYWVQRIEELLPTAEGQSRILEEKENYTGFFDNYFGKGHVTFTIDLGRINSPDQYILFFEILDQMSIGQGKDFCYFTDFSDSLAYIPAPIFSIYTHQTTLRPGDEKLIDLKITSNVVTTPQISLAVKNQSGLSLNLLSKQPYLNTAGLAASRLGVKIWDNASSHAYLVPIYGNISFPKFNLTEGVLPNQANFIPIQDQNQSLPNSIPLNSSILEINVLKSLTPGERIQGFWNAYGGVIGFVGGGFIAGFTVLMFDRLKKRKKQHWYVD